MEGFEKFKQAFYRAFMAELISLEEGEVEETTMKRFLGLGSKLGSNDALAEKASVMTRLSQTVLGVESSYESLLDAEVYINSFLFKNTRITKVRYLRYVFENYLNEVYILKERLKKFLNTLQELYASGPRAREVRKIVGPLFQYNSDEFETLVGVRGAHVHSMRYNDKELEQLEFLEGNLRYLFDSTPNAAASLRRRLEELYDHHYVPIREKKAERLRILNLGIGRIVDKIFGEAHPVVFDADGNLHLPKRMAGQSS